MAIEPIFERINYLKRREELKEQIKSECKTDVFSEETESILNVSARAQIESVTVLDGKAEYVGKIIYYVCYSDADGELKKTECGNEFSGVVKGGEFKAGARASGSVTVDKAEADNVGVKLSVYAYLTVKIRVEEQEFLSALSGGENLVVDKKEVPFVKSLGVRYGNYPIEEEFELGYPVEEVVFHRADAIITAVQCGVGTIIVDGEVLLSAIMLQKNEKRDIIRENKSVPFRAEIECEEAMPAMQAVARVNEKSFKTEVTVDEDRGVSVVGVEVSLRFEGEAFTDGTAVLACDAFSIEQNVELEREEIPCYKAMELRCATTRVSGRAVVDDLPIGTTLFAIGGERTEITEKECDGGNLKVVGALTAVGYFGSDGKFFTRKLETPFDCTLDCAFSCDTDIDIVLKPQKAKGKIITLTEIEIEAEMLFDIYPTEKFKTRFVKGIKVTGEKQMNEYALSVYIPTEGEELWSLAKRLNVCPDVLVETNKELCFPLTGKERIVIYRQKR